MNQELQRFARNYIKRGLEQCTEGQQRCFKLMYAYGKMGASIEVIVDTIPENDLGKALEQVRIMTERNERKNADS